MTMEPEYHGNSLLTFCKIPPNESRMFREFREDHYFTIQTLADEQNQDGKIVENFHIPRGQSIIVTSSGEVKFRKKKNPSVWMDEEGRIHGKRGDGIDY